MSNITTIYDRILVELDTLFPSTDYTRIPYPYDLIKNDDNFLRKGYGIKMGSASRVDLEFCSLAYEREITVVLTREVFNTGSDVTVFDDIIKGIMEDVYDVHDRFFEPDQLTIDSNIVMIQPIGTSAIEQVEGDKLTFLSMEISFNFTIKELI